MATEQMFFGVKITLFFYKKIGQTFTIVNQIKIISLVQCLTSSSIISLFKLYVMVKIKFWIFFIKTICSQPAGVIPLSTDFKS